MTPFMFNSGLYPGHINDAFIVMATSSEDAAIKAHKYQAENDASNVISEVSDPSNWVEVEGDVIYYCNGDY